MLVSFAGPELHYIPLQCPKPDINTLYGIPYKIGSRNSRSQIPHLIKPSFYKKQSLSPAKPPNAPP